MKKILFLSMAVVLLSAPAMAVVLVVNDYEGDNSGSTGVVTRNWGWQSTFTNEPDVPTGGGTGAAKAVLTVADSGGFGMAFDDPLFSGNTLDLSAFAADGFLNFYIKIDAAITSIGNFGWRCCQGDGDPQPDQFNILDPPLPTPDTWTYISIKVSDIPETGPVGPASWATIDSAWFQIAGPVGATVQLDHVTFSDTPEEGMLDFSAPASATASVTQTGGDPFTTGTASWDVTFSESVTGVLVGQFSASLSGDAAAGAVTLGGSDPNFTIDIAGVSGAAGAIGLTFAPAGAVLAASNDDEVAGFSNAAWYSNFPVAPAATGWVLVFLGVMLALATAVTLRKRAASER